MTDKKQPEALRDARWYMLNKDGMATLCTSKKDAGKEARAMDMAWPHMGPHRAVQLVEAADVEALRAGYAAARLEIQSLQARIKTMAEEHADELMVAHLDGMRAAQPAGAANTRAQENAALLADILNRRPAMNAGLTQAYAAWTAEVYDLMGAIAAEPANEDRAQAAPQPSPASQGDALDTARLDWLDNNIFYRDMPEWDAKYVHDSAHYSMWVLFAPKVAQGSARSIIDAARAAHQKGEAP